MKTEFRSADSYSTFMVPPIRKIVGLAFLPFVLSCGTRLANESDWLMPLTIPPTSMGTCERGAFNGGLFAEPGKGAFQIVLHIGDPVMNGRDMRVVLDSSRRAILYTDEASFPRTRGITTFLSVVTGLDSTGNVTDGMQHHLEGSAGSLKPISDVALPRSRYAAVVQAAAEIRSRCGA